MMMGKEMLMFFMSLALGYILCVVAKKQTSVLKTLGYTLGISMIVMAFLVALLVSQHCCGTACTGMHGNMGGMNKMGCGMMKHSMHVKGAK